MQSERYQVSVLKMKCLSMINYCYLVMDLFTKRAVIIDASWNLDCIDQKIMELGATLEGIILTHAHFDHTNLAKRLAMKYNASVFMSVKEIETSGFCCHNLQGVLDGEEIQLGQTIIKCIHTPGHTAGSMCFYTVGSLFTGDTIFIEGCGMCMGAGSSPNDMYHSIQKIKSRIPRETKIYPGHSYGKMPGCQMADLLQYNIYFLIEEEEKFVDFRMRKGQKNLFQFM